MDPNKSISTGNFHSAKPFWLRLLSSNKGNTWKVFPNPYKEWTISLVNLVPGFDFGVPLSLKLAQILGKHESFSSVNIDRISDWLTSMLGKSMRGIYLLEIAWNGNVEFIRILNQ